VTAASAPTVSPARPNPVCVFAVPGNLEAPTGGYVYDRRLLELLPQHGIEMAYLQLPQRFPHPAASDLLRTAGLFENTPESAILLIDGLAYGCLPDRLIARIGRKIVALVHHPLALETGLSQRQRDEFEQRERSALAAANRVIATSATTARLLSMGYGVPAERLTVARPGTEPGRRGRSSQQSAPERLKLLAVGSVIPRKGYDILVRALAELAGYNWHANIVGSHALDPSAVTALKQDIAAHHLQHRITLCGEYEGERLEEAFQSAHVFVMASHYEGYGMALCEAMVRGLPLVTTTGGALADTAPEGVALRVAPGSVAALADALRCVLSDAALRCRLAEASWRAGQSLPSWTQTAAVVGRVLGGAAA
jgi:glycosyltransferase involved in cell wall biosynthesis